VALISWCLVLLACGIAAGRIQDVFGSKNEFYLDRVLTFDRPDFSQS
jgi:hypothetical protein